MSDNWYDNLPEPFSGFYNLNKDQEERGNITTSNISAKVNSRKNLELISKVMDEPKIRKKPGPKPKKKSDTNSILIPIKENRFQNNMKLFMDFVNPLNI